MHQNTANVSCGASFLGAKFLKKVYIYLFRQLTPHHKYQQTGDMNSKQTICETHVAEIEYATDHKHVTQNAPLLLRLLDCFRRPYGKEICNACHK